MEPLRERQIIQIACHHLQSPFQDTRPGTHIKEEDDADMESDGTDSDTFFDLYYMRRLCPLSTFLQQDTSVLFEDYPASIDSSTSSAMSTSVEPTERFLHRYILLQHPGVENSSIYFNPASDILWLSHEIELESVKELRRFYGSQLDSIESVIVEESGLWVSADMARGILDVLVGIRVVYVWLESYRFENGVPLTTESGYLHQAREFEARDRAAFQGRTLMVEYIDHEGNVFGGFRSGAVRD
ncbi:hypothetical protein B0I35DRAFT_427312 [Stachybotrys elegans]|uniref:Uncharacterized protein n=1 Tax=Stachybotrys elegans TaxID=80388 RepID=A0A8K0SZY3_9HYPO|nr:hypothetical protein B0I35DRAFT_427312 [Stachybotrys elegans]